MNNFIVRSKSRKRKNAYVVKIEGVLANYNAFGGCKEMPLIVAEKNGEIQKTDGWAATTMFKNPGALDIVLNHEKYKEIFGERIASMIIDYCDKNSGIPVVTLFPNMIWVDGENMNDVLGRMNHETRRDCLRQIKMRKDLLRNFETRYK